MTLLEVQQKLQTNTELQTRQQQTVKRHKAAVEALDVTIAELASAIELCKLSLKDRTKVKEDIEQLATLMLQALFDEDHRFEFVPVHDNEVLVGLKPQIYHFDTPNEPRKFGGGVRNVVSFAVRMLFVVLKKELSPIMILDEPFVNLDHEKWQKLIAFIEDLQRDLQIQIIMVTHSGNEFPQTFEVRKPNKISIVKELTA